jgi:hypothetical protein
MQIHANLVRRFNIGQFWGSRRANFVKIVILSRLFVTPPGVSLPTYPETLRPVSDDAVINKDYAMWYSGVLASPPNRDLCKQGLYP